MKKHLFWPFYHEVFICKTQILMAVIARSFLLKCHNSRGQRLGDSYRWKHTGCVLQTGDGASFINFYQMLSRRARVTFDMQQRHQLSRQHLTERVITLCKQTRSILNSVSAIKRVLLCHFLRFLRRRQRMKPCETFTLLFTFLFCLTNFSFLTMTTEMSS